MAKPIYILLVNPNQAERNLIQRALEAASPAFNITPAISLAEAQICLVKQPIDLLISVPALPDGSTAHILAIPNRPPCIILSASADLAAAAFESGAEAAFYMDPQQQFLKLLPPFIQKTLEQQIKSQKLAEEHLQREQTELEAHQASERFKILFDDLSDPIIIHDLSGKLMEANAAACKHFGYAREELLQMNLQQLIPAEIGSLFMRRTAQLSRVEHMIFDSTHISSTGEHIPVEAHIKATTFNGQNAVIAISRDIRERKASEENSLRSRLVAEALRDTAAALNSTLDFDELLGRILDNLHRVVPFDAANICLLDDQKDQKTVMLVRYTGYEKFGLSETELGQIRIPLNAYHLFKEMAEKNIVGLIPCVEEDPEWVPSPISAWVHSYLGAPLFIKGELAGFINLDSAIPYFYTNEHKETLAFFAHQAATAIENARLYQSLQSDLAERERMQDSMMATQKLADLGTLAAGVAHELNSPLQVITGLCESNLMSIDEHKTIEPERLKKSLNLINRSAWRMCDIIKALSLYSRASNEFLDEENLNSIIYDALLLLEHQFSRWTNILIETDLQENMPFYTCDRNKIIQVIINLITNARDSMSLGGEIILRSRFDAQNHCFTIQVIDEGEGIPPEVIDRIFDPFFTTKPPGKGTGLGLPIVKGIIQAHGGQIDVQSTPQKGTTVTITLPQDKRVVTANDLHYSQGRYDGSNA
ncbi:MAG TPA: ATP-binding protein [Anaerolineaceae bacterium]|nr:ATP-binding protein [Anaerolineaceae bacterium]HPN53379.1 ATP-binding protein [Anaerolineaceae bacterium]